MEVRANASGKVLIVGGYLIIEPAFSGVSISVSARFHASVKPLPVDDARRLELKEGSTKFPITVYAPQRHSSCLAYEYSSTDQILVETSSEVKNPFVFLTLKYTLLLASSLLGDEQLQQRLKHGLFITLHGDRAFYTAGGHEQLHTTSGISSQGSSEEDEKIFPVDPNNPSKTGLGSSAALVAALVTALLRFIGVLASTEVEEKQNENPLTLAHNLAQFIHCAAQGKIGSGFDISSAFWCSHSYTRFSPSLLRYTYITSHCIF